MDISYREPDRAGANGFGTLVYRYVFKASGSYLFCYQEYEVLAVHAQLGQHMPYLATFADVRSPLTSLFPFHRI